MLDINFNSFVLLTKYDNLELALLKDLSSHILTSLVYEYFLDFLMFKNLNSS